MIRIRAILVLLLAALVGCGDGGPVGSGISASTVSGNVIEVEASSGGAATLAVPLVVSIDEAPDVQDEVDADGNFELIGDFSGTVTVRFTGDGVNADTQEYVPQGSTVVLDDVAIEGTGVSVGFREAKNFLGRITLRDCAADVPMLLVNDLRPIANQFMVRLTNDTVIVNRRGNRLGCGQLSACGAGGGPCLLIAVRGVLGRSDGVPDGTIEAVSIILDPPPPSEQQPVAERYFKGVATVINCSSGNIEINEKVGGTRLKLNAAASIVGADLQPLPCGNIGVGHELEGRGEFLVRDPSVVQVIRMVVKPPVSEPG